MVRSAFALRHGNPRVVDVALDFVFDTHEGFTRAFTNAIGIAPKKYADFPHSDDWLIPYCYLNRKKNKLETSEMKDKTAVIFTQIVQRPARKLILLRSRNAEDYFEYCEEVGCGSSGNSAAWDTLCDIKEALYEPVGLWLPENMRKHSTGIYAHGVEVPAEYSENLPEGFDVIELEPCMLLIFQGEPYDDENFESEVNDYMQRIQKFNPQVYGYKYADQLAPRMQLEPWGWRGYIEMRPVTSVG